MSKPNHEIPDALAADVTLSAPLGMPDDVRRCSDTPQKTTMTPDSVNPPQKFDPLNQNWITVRHPDGKTQDWLLDKGVPVGELMRRIRHAFPDLVESYKPKILCLFVQPDPEAAWVLADSSDQLSEEAKYELRALTYQETIPRPWWMGPPPTPEQDDEARRRPGAISAPERVSPDVYGGPAGREDGSR